MALPRWFDDTFKVSVTLKGIDGALEIASGAALLFVRPATLDHIARSLTEHELSQDPHDFIARHILKSAGHLTHDGTLFAAIYLLSHGIAKWSSSSSCFAIVSGRIRRRSPCSAPSSPTSSIGSRTESPSVSHCSRFSTRS